MCCVRAKIQTTLSDKAEWKEFVTVVNMKESSQFNVVVGNVSVSSSTTMFQEPRFLLIQKIKDSTIQ
jgi:hypothetical protein